MKIHKLTRPLVLTVALSAMLSPKTHAGAVSGGGGGTTNPKPADPEWVIGFGNRDASKILITWLNRQEEYFNWLSESQKQASPFFKLFRSDKNIFDIMKQASFEFEMSHPCHDAGGNAKDGSIYGSKPGAICISPFSMAPKLNENNVEQETVALMLHELTHLVGTTEEEAEKIQQLALWDFNKMDFVDTLVNIDLLNRNFQNIGAIGELLAEFDYVFRFDLLSRVDVERLDRQMTDIMNRFKLRIAKVLLPREHSYRVFSTQFVKLHALQYWLITQDQKEGLPVRQFYQERLDKGFGADHNVTARTFLARNDDRDPAEYGSETDEIVLHRVSNVDEAMASLREIRDYMLNIQKEIEALGKATFSLQRIP